MTVQELIDILNNAPPDMKVSMMVQTKNEDMIEGIVDNLGSAGIAADRLWLTSETSVNMHKEYLKGKNDDS